jgi:hypothetical protein
MVLQDCFLGLRSGVPAQVHNVDLFSSNWT